MLNKYIKFTLSISILISMHSTHAIRVYLNSDSNFESLPTCTSKPYSGAYGIFNLTKSANSMRIKAYLKSTPNKSKFLDPQDSPKGSLIRSVLTSHPFQSIFGTDDSSSNILVLELYQDKKLKGKAECYMQDSTLRYHIFKGADTNPKINSNYNLGRWAVDILTLNQASTKNVKDLLKKDGYPVVYNQLDPQTPIYISLQVGWDKKNKLPRFGIRDIAIRANHQMFYKVWSGQKQKLNKDCPKQN
jgi:hypothetical protein